jgi:hypothetical protein
VSAMREREREREKGFYPSTSTMKKGERQNGEVNKK